MGIWFTIFICGGIGVYISLKYLGKNVKFIDYFLVHCLYYLFDY